VRSYRKSPDGVRILAVPTYGPRVPTPGRL